MLVCSASHGCASLTITTSSSLTTVIAAAVLPAGVHLLELPAVTKAAVLQECDQGWVLQGAGRRRASSHNALCRLQVLASLRVEQQKPEEALQHLRASMQLWYPSLQKMMADSDLDSQDSEEEDEKDMSEPEKETDAQLPSFEFRFETAKLLIELDETTEHAVQVRT